MERIISPDNIEYQKYLGELTTFLHNKDEHENKVNKELMKGNSLSKNIENITYNYDSEGNFIFIDKNNGNSTKIVKPKYIDIFDRLNVLEEERNTIKNILIKCRQEILGGSEDEMITKNFYDFKEKYIKTTKEIDDLKLYFNQINKTDEINEELKDLEKEKDILEEELRLIFYEMKLKYEDSVEWNRLARIYLSKDDGSTRQKLNIVNKRIIDISKIYSIDKLEDGKFKLEIDNINCHNYKILTIPSIDKTLGKSKKKRVEIDSETLFFNSKSKDYKFLSNFNENTFSSVIYGFPEDSEVFVWKTVEHYFQASKFSTSDPENIDYIKEIIKSKSPAIARKLGKTKKPKNGARIREDWDRETENILKDSDIKLKIKDLVMIEGIRLKFSQNSDLLDKLLDTYPKILIELSSTDNYWGSNKDKKGLNMLGKILMFYRDSLNKEDISSFNSGDVSSLDESSDSDKKVILKRGKKIKKTSKSKISENSKEHSGGKSILKMKGTKKNNKSIKWLNEDSLGNKLNDSNYDLNNNLEKIDMKSLDLNILNDKNEMEENNLSNNKNNDLTVVNLEDNLDMIDIENLNMGNTDKYEIKEIKINTKKNDSSNNYFSDIKVPDENSNLNILNFASNESNNSDNFSEIKNIQIKL